MTMTDAEVYARVADMLDLLTRSDYLCPDDLSDELRDDIDDDATTEQHYAIAEQVEAWWHAQD